MFLAIAALGPVFSGCLIASSIEPIMANTVVISSSKVNVGSCGMDLEYRLLALTCQALKSMSVVEVIKG